MLTANDIKPGDVLQYDPDGRMGQYAHLRYRITEVCATAIGHKVRAEEVNKDGTGYPCELNPNDLAKMIFAPTPSPWDDIKVGDIIEGMDYGVAYVVDYIGKKRWLGRRTDTNEEVASTKASWWHKVPPKLPDTWCNVWLDPDNVLRIGLQHSSKEKAIGKRSTRKYLGVVHIDPDGNATLVRDDA